MTNADVTAWTKRFWHSVGRPEPFPRSLESSVAWALPLAVIKLPHLGLFNMSKWLARREIVDLCPGGDRRLYACLVAKSGHGLVFLDGSDPGDERRFSLAHEVVHFIRDYLEPRNKALAVLGEPGREVLDGLRPPTPEERLQAIFHNIELGTYTHMMERSPSGGVTKLRILEAEDHADRLALELLAPRASVIDCLEKRHIIWRSPTAFKVAQEVLAQRYGLPIPVAKRYGRMLVLNRRPSRTFQEWLSR